MPVNPAEHGVLGTYTGRGARRNGALKVLALLLPAAEAAEEPDDDADQKHEAEAAAAVGRAADIEAATTEEQHEDDDEKHEVHGAKVAPPRARRYGALTPVAGGAGVFFTVHLSMFIGHWSEPDEQWAMDDEK